MPSLLTAVPVQFVFAISSDVAGAIPASALRHLRRRVAWSSDYFDAEGSHRRHLLRGADGRKCQIEPDTIFRDPLSARLVASRRVPKRRPNDPRTAGWEADVTLRVSDAFSMVILTIR